MKTRWLILAAVVGLLWPGAHAAAQVRYTDAEGVTHFVTSLDEVPQQYRAGALGKPVPPAKPSGKVDWGQKARDANKPGELTGPACDAAVDALAARQGSVTRFDVRREFGPACEQRMLTMFERAPEVTRICGERIRAVVGNYPAGKVTKAQLRVTAGPGCQVYVDQLWNDLQKNH